MIVLALDIATSTGACWDGPEGRPVFQTHTCPPLGLGQKCKSFAAWLDELITVVQPGLVAVEAPLMRTRGVQLRSSIDVDRLLITMAGIAQFVAACNGIATTEKNVQTVKKHLTGFAHADKQAMVDRCRMIGWAVRNDHEADAAALWSLVKSERELGWAPQGTVLFGRRHP